MTYDDPAVIYGSSRVKYDGSPDDTEGDGLPPRATASEPRPKATASAGTLTEGD